MTGFALLFLGELTHARRAIERMLDGPRPSVHEPYIVRFQFDPWVTARSRLATILWLQGYPTKPSPPPSKVSKKLWLRIMR